MSELLPVADDDLAPFVALNNLAVPNVNHLDEAAMKALLGQAWWCRQVRHEESLQGFLLVLKPGEAYASDNYRWFSAHYDEFAYVDRIVVGEACRSQGLGALLYRALEEDARAAGLPRICCEVNLDPPNPRSLAFHRRLGFETVGEQETKAGSVKVSLLVKELL